MRNQKFVHLESQKTYTLLCITNEAATKSEFVKQAVYIGSDGQIWSRPLTEFQTKFYEVENQQDEQETVKTD